MRLRDVFYVDGFHINLISFGQLVTDSFLIGQVSDVGVKIGYGGINALKFPRNISSLKK